MVGGDGHLYRDDDDHDVTDVVGNMDSTKASSESHCQAKARMDFSYRA